MTYTPTQLGKMLGMSSREVNKLLEKMGYQKKSIVFFPSLNNAMSSTWMPTEQGKNYACESTGDWPGLRWNEEIIDILKNN